MRNDYAHSMIHVTLHMAVSVVFVSTLSSTSTAKGIIWFPVV